MDDLTKLFSEGPLDGIVDKIWGEVVVGIGQGKGREKLCLYLMKLMQTQYERGIEEGIKRERKSKKSKQ